MTRANACCGKEDFRLGICIDYMHLRLLRWGCTHEQANPMGLLSRQWGSLDAELLQQRQLGQNLRVPLQAAIRNTLSWFSRHLPLWGGHPRGQNRRLSSSRLLHLDVRQAPDRAAAQVDDLQPCVGSQLLRQPEATHATGVPCLCEQGS